MLWTIWLALGAILGAASVGFGAFGAHALKAKLSLEDLAIYETACRYAMYHALALCVVGLVTLRFDSRLVHIAGSGFFLGVLIFSGSLIALVFTGQRTLGAVTPIGGVLLIASWLLLAAGVMFYRPSI
jgi:uncharacterized membrane protein YgdD (TMEM256/DUF423 family)